ncbi:hypothetical protein EG327_000931, partial [Venturia inaequalis]
TPEAPKTVRQLPLIPRKALRVSDFTAAINDIPPFSPIAGPSARGRGKEIQQEEETFDEYE